MGPHKNFNKNRGNSLNVAKIFTLTFTVFIRTRGLVKIQLYVSLKTDEKQTSVYILICCTRV